MMEIWIQAGHIWTASVAIAPAKGEYMDILLTPDGDLKIDERGDISLTDSIRQAIRIRLLWFFDEWRFEPGWGIPYFEKVFVKNPNLLRIRSIIRREILAVDGVDSVNSIDITVIPATRSAAISFVVRIGNENFREEVTIFEQIRPNA